VRLKLSDTRVYEPQIRARLGTTAGERARDRQARGAANPSPREARALLGPYRSDAALQGYLAHKKTPSPLGPP